MKISLPGLFNNVEVALRTSRDDYACASAYSLGELIDNLIVLKTGGCTIEEFFNCYVVDCESKGKFADRVKTENYACMQDDECEDRDAA